MDRERKLHRALWPTCRVLWRIPTRPSWQIQQEQDTTGCKQGEPLPGDGAGRDGGVLLRHLGCTGMRGHLPGESVELATHGGSCTQHCPVRESWELGGAAARTHGDGPPPRQHGLARLCSAHTQGSPVIKNNEILPFGMTWMDPGGILLSDISQTETNTIWFHLRVEYKKETK